MFGLGSSRPCEFSRGQKGVGKVAQHTESGQTMKEGMGEGKPQGAESDEEKSWSGDEVNTEQRAVKGGR
jgi:hypothetical protein